MNILFLDACIRKESRTRLLAEAVLQKLDAPVQELFLYDESIQPLTPETFAHREECLRRGDLGDEMFRYARDFADADVIVVAAPYWDLSYPAVIKAYVEQIMINGITFRYSEEGIPSGLCRARKLIYVSTAGGPVFDGNMGYRYLKTLAHSFWGIPETVLFQAERLDIAGADIGQILSETLSEISASDL